MRITREKRPDRVICKWGKFTVERQDNNALISIEFSRFVQFVTIPLSEIPNLIKALLEVSKETK